MIMPNKVFTAIGSPNIAFTKYWGKRKGEAENLPNNSSFSMTLGGEGDPIFTITSVAFSSALGKDTFYVDGKAEESPKGAQSIINYLRKAARANEHALVVSYNSFPKSAGIASSASASAALAFVASEALGLRLSTKELSIAARIGSGSGARSVMGGLVEWKKGTRSDGRDSYAVQVADKDYWPELVDVIFLISKGAKKVSTNAGHERTVETSALYKARPSSAEASTEKAISAARKMDFNTLAEVIMRDSNSLHATMLDSYPPIRYLTDDSWKVVDVIEALNSEKGKNVTAYTFDAGPNAHVITTDEYVFELKRRVREVLPEVSVIESKAGEGPRMLTHGPELIHAMRPIAYEREYLINEVKIRS